MESAFNRLVLMTPTNLFWSGVCMSNLLWIGFGGFLGSILRYIFSGILQGAFKCVDFPYGTIAVNLTGCLMIGFLSQLAESHGAFTVETRVFLFIGFLGGFTTFSTFGYETINLFRDSENLLAFLNVALHIIFGLGAVWLGRTFAYLIWR
jgi:fluoride exporter